MILPARLSPLAILCAGLWLLSIPLDADETRKPPAVDLSDLREVLIANHASGFLEVDRTGDVSVPNFDEVIGLHFEARARDEHLQFLKDIENIRALDLSGTQVSADGLQQMSTYASLQRLEHLELPASITDDDLIHVGQFANLRVLKLCGTKVSGPGLEHLRHLQKLRTLDIRGAFSRDNLTHLKHTLGLHTLLLQLVRDEDFIYLQRLVHLETLVLDRSEEFTGSGFGSLKHFKKLKAVSITSSGLDDDGIEQLSNISSIEDLWIGNAKLTAACIDDVVRLQKLKVLSLGAVELSAKELTMIADNLTELERLAIRSSKIDDEGLRQIARLKQLRYLGLSEIEMSQQGMKYLSQLPKLRELRVFHTDVDNDSLALLKEFPRLEVFEFTKSRVSETGIRQLRRELPDAKVIGG